MRGIVEEERRASGFRKVRKRMVLWVFGLVAVLVFFVGGWGLWVGLQMRNTVIAGRNFYRVVMRNQSEEFETSYKVWVGEYSELKKRVDILDRVTGGVLENKLRFRESLERVEVLNRELPRLLGREGEKTYFVLLQNNMELRPSGGFMGSYAKVKFDKGSLVEVAIQDIYVPDGQLAGHVDPPWPIQEAFGQGWWKLRDANWDPDFPTAARAIEWFFEKGGEEKMDGMVAVNLGLVEEILRIVGPVELPDFDRVVTADDLYDVAQYYAEANFFPGSTQKKDILAALGKMLLVKLGRLSSQEMVKILGVLQKGLDERQILVSLDDQNGQDLMMKWRWSGEMRRRLVSGKGNLSDYLYLVETNLGANKANCCVERKVKQEVDLTDEGLVKERLVVGYENLEGKERASWGGDYNNFLRVYLPVEARVLSIKVNWEEVLEEKRLVDEREDLGMNGVGFFVRVIKGGKGEVEVVYELPALGPYGVYELEVQKQPGINSLNYELGVRDKKGLRELQKDLRKDEVISYDVR